MVKGGGAGSSAAEQAKRLRDEAARLEEKVARLEEEADQWDAGAHGERLSGELLTPIRANGCVVLHDLAIPGSKANVDHVVVAPWGVAVIDTKNYSRPVKLRDGMLWRGKYPMRRELDTVIWETDRVRSAITRALPQWQLTYRSILCIHGPHQLQPGLRVGAVEVVAPQDLVASLTAGPALLSPAHVTAVGSILRSNLEPRTAQPLPSGPSRPPLHWSGPLPERPRRSSPTRPGPVAPKRTIGPPVWPRPAPRLSSTGKRALLIVGALVLIASAGGTLAVSLRRLVALPASHAPTTPTTTVPAPPILTFECPAAGRGWSLRLMWKATDVPRETWEASTAPTDAGPWNIRYIGGPQPTAPIVSGLDPGTRLVVRAGGIASVATSQVTVTAPVASC